MMLLAGRRSLLRRVHGCRNMEAGGGGDNCLPPPIFWPIIILEARSVLSKDFILR